MKSSHRRGTSRSDVIDSEPEIRRRELQRADILLVRKLTMEEARLATRLKWIQSTAVGIGPILRPDVVDRDVIVTNARGLHARFIAEHAIALTLALRRNLHITLERQRERIWAQTEIEAIPCPPTDESRVLVIGLEKSVRALRAWRSGWDSLSTPSGGDRSLAVPQEWNTLLVQMHCTRNCDMPTLSCWRPLRPRRPRRRSALRNWR